MHGRTTRPLLFALSLGLLLTLACARPTPTVQRGPDAEVTFDGLHRVDDSRAQYAWMKPDIDLSAYDAVRLELAEVEYRAVRPHRNIGVSTGPGRQDYPMDERQKRRLVDIVTEVFRSELERSEHFALTEAPGPRVLSLRASLLDVVSHVPPEPRGRGDVFVRSVGEATLVLELRDSESGEIFARSIDRRSAERMGQLTLSSPPTNAVEVRRAASIWARALRESLDRLHGTAAPSS
ncbi:MAG: DUF3313 domain-containing protein [Proteobacteria bacterium]|nr:DUF3313 domain-containing protein [Pseudomonadota bacterium]